MIHLIRRGVLLTCLLLIGSSAACVTNGLFSQQVKSRVLAMAPVDQDPKLVTLEIESYRGRLAVEELIISDIERARNVYAVRRGSGFNTLYVAMKGTADPYSLQYAVPDGYRVRVLAVERAEDL